MATINGRPSTGAPTDTRVVLQNGSAAIGNGVVLPIAPGDIVRVVVQGVAANATVGYEWSDDGFVTAYVAAMEDIESATGVASKPLQTSVGASKANLLFRPPPGCTGFRTPIKARVAGTITVTAFRQSR